MKRYFILSLILTFLLFSCTSPITPENKGWYVSNYTNDDISIIIKTATIAIPAGKNYFSSDMENPTEIKKIDTTKYKLLTSYFYFINKNKKIYHECRIVPKDY